MPAHMTLRKPAKGTAAKAWRARRARIERVERAAKRDAKNRDGWRCRRCGSMQGAGNWPFRKLATVEAAHIVTKGMGGDGGRYSCERKHFMTLCADCHRGPRSLHSGHVRVVYDPEVMGDGPVEFFDQELLAIFRP